MITPCPRSCGLGESSRITHNWWQCSLFEREFLMFFLVTVHMPDFLNVYVPPLQNITIHSKCTVTNSLANLGQQAILRNEKSSARKSYSEIVFQKLYSPDAHLIRRSKIEIRMLKFLDYLTQYCWAIGWFQKYTSLVCPGESLGISPRSTTQLQKETDS